MRTLKKIYQKLIYHGPLVGLVSFFWFLFRTGTKPSRFVYPCQKAAFYNILLFVPLFISSVVSWFKRHLSLVRIVFLVSLLLPLLVFGRRYAQRFYLNWRAKVIIPNLSLPARQAQAQAVSTLYVVENIPLTPSGPEDHGVNALLDLMAQHGLSLEQIVGANDVLVIKINSMFDDRGGTNTDVIRGLIYRIVNRSGGFNGEIVVLDNTQYVNSYFNWTQSNAENPSQSIQDVVNEFAGQGHEVSTYRWHDIGGECGGDCARVDCAQYPNRDCYYCDSGNDVSYDKFTTTYGTLINMRDGVWNGSSYDNSRLKFFNVPILKRHLDFGVTSALKNFIGFLNKPCHGDFHTKGIVQGLFAKLMIHGRGPDLHIIDAIYVAPHEGPDVGWHNNRFGALVASKDPVAADYYAGKYILYPVSGSGKTNPDQSNTFRTTLISNRDYFESRGVPSTINEAEMDVYVYDFEDPTPTPSPTPTPIPTSTPTVPPSPTPSPTPTPTLTPTSTPIPTPTPTPTEGDLLGVKFKLQGTTTARSSQPVRIKIAQGTNILWTFDDVESPADENGVFTGVIDTSDICSDFSGSYDILIKSGSHLQKRFENLNLSCGLIEFDFSTTQDEVLLVGDVNDTNTITIEDVVSVLTFYTDFVIPVAPYTPQDVNFDETITIDDIALSLINYTDFEIPGDE
jgi:hypothetical protein